jgi:hypothetical protein
MLIPHLVKQGSFRPKLSRWIGQVKEQIEEGSLAQMDLQKGGGYPGENIKITIMQKDIKNFDTDWEFEDWTRFPARIRALATAFKDNWMWGTYLVSHNMMVL